MADATSTAEVVRDRSEASGGGNAAPVATEAAPPAAPPSGLSSVAELALGNYLGAQSRLQQKTQGVADTLRPQVGDLQQAFKSFQEEALRTQPVAPVTTLPPKRELHAFLAPHENESPEASVAKFTSAIALFATGIAGLAKGDARGALSALTGALQGWQDGDLARADREFADWKAKTDALLTQWDTQRAQWEDWFKASKLSLDQRTKGLELAMLQAGYEIDPAKVEAEGAKYMLDFIDRREQSAAQLALTRDRILDARERSKRVEEHQRRMEEFKQQEIDLKRKEAESAVAAYDDPVILKDLGRDYFLYRKLPPNIARGKAGQALLPKILAAGREWAVENGIDPNSAPHVRADIEAAQKALNDTEKRASVAEVAVGTFERHIDQLVSLSKDVPRSEMPIINKAIVEGQRNIQGSPAAQAYVAIAYEAGQEFAKVSVGTAQGDSSSREEARKAIAVSMSHEQLVKVAEELKKTAKSRMDQYGATAQRLRGVIQSPGAPKKSALPEGGKPTETARVVIVNDKGERGSVPADTDLSKYPGWRRE